MPTTAGMSEYQHDISYQLPSKFAYRCHIDPLEGSLVAALFDIHLNILPTQQAVKQPIET